MIPRRTPEITLLILTAFSPLAIRTSAQTLGRHGRIMSLRVSGDWTEYRNDVGIFHTLGLQRKEQDTVSIHSHFVFTPLEDPAAQSFKKILDRTPHALSPAEIDSLSSMYLRLIRAAPDEFQVTSARTTNATRAAPGAPLRLIVIEGKYTKQAFNAYFLLLDASGCAKLPQIVAYIAPTKDYPRSLNDAKTALTNILWGPPIADFCQPAR